MTPDQHEEIFVVFDSNVLRNNDNALESFDEFGLGVCDEIQKFILDNHLEKKVHILLPQIVLLELRQSKIRKLSRWAATICDYARNFSHFSDFIHRAGLLNPTEHVEKILSAKTLDFETVEIPEDHDLLFKKILERSIHKTPPFVDESDRGFKDTILFLSLLKYAADNYAQSNSKFVLFTEDGGFKDTDKQKNKTELEKEFTSTGNILIIQNNRDALTFIRDAFKFDLDLMDHIRAILSKLEEDLSNYRFIVVDGEKYEIVEYSLSNQTYQEEEGGRIKITAMFDILHSTVPDSDVVEIDKPCIAILSKEIVLDKSTKKIVAETDFNYELLKNG